MTTKIPEDEHPSNPGRSSRPWRCGRDYQTLLPESNEGDPWLALLRPAIRADNERCRARRDEVHNVLFMASLFSAVQTAFIVEFFEYFDDDPVEVLLSRILEATVNATDSTSSASIPSPTPSNHGTRINILWFLGFVFSLLAVLVSFTSLQWIREHQQILSSDLEPQVAYSILQTQTEAFNTWFVPHTITAPTVLLQVALALFLVGLLDLTLSINPVVGMYVAVPVGMALLFLFMTTILPALQDLSLLSPHSSGLPRSPCPYRSPQSWAFHRLISWFIGVASIFGEASDGVRRIDPRNLISHEARANWWDAIPHGAGMIFRMCRKDGWLEHSVGWLFQRDFDYMSNIKCNSLGTLNPLRFTRRPIPVYDALRGLLEEKRSSLFVGQKNWTPLDHCIGMVFSANRDPNRPHEGYYAAFLNQMSQTETLLYGLPQGIVDADDLDVLQDDAALRLLSRNNGFNNLPLGAEEWGVELCVRLTRWLYAEKPRQWRQPDPEIYMPQSLPIQWVVDLLEKGLISPTTKDSLQGQIREVTLDFFGRVRGSECTIESLDTTMDNNIHVGHFLSSAARILTYDGDHSICDQILGLIEGSSGPTSYPPQAALRFCQTIIFREAVIMTEPLSRFIVALHRFKSRGLEKPIVAAPNFSWKGFADRANSLGVKVGEDVQDNAAHMAAKDPTIENPSIFAVVPYPKLRAQTAP